MKNKKLQIVTTIIFFLLNLLLSAQNHNKIDSLKIIIKKTNIDTSLIKTMYLLGNEFSKSNIDDSALIYYFKVIKLGENIFFYKTKYVNSTLTNILRYKIKTYSFIGDIYTSKQETPKAIDYYKKGLEILDGKILLNNCKFQLSHKDSNSIAMINNKLGNIYFRTDLTSEAMKCFLATINIYYHQIWTIYYNFNFERISMGQKFLNTCLIL